MDADLIEMLSEKVHAGWAEEKQRQGFADHVFSAVYDNDLNRVCFQPSPHGDSAYCYLPEEDHHTDMLPYADLAEHIKDYDRATVRAVLSALEASGYRILSSDVLRRLQTAVAMLNSMVLSGEDHSDTSRAAVRSALAAAQSETPTR